MKMKTFLIKSNYQYEIEANNEEEALEKWNETIEDELGSQNETLTTKFIDSLSVEEIRGSSKEKKFKVRVKQVYTYDNIPAKTKEEAIQKVLDMDWRGHDECDQPLETSVVEDEEE